MGDRFRWNSGGPELLHANYRIQDERLEERLRTVSRQAARLPCSTFAPSISTS